jgi:hypothetical protein
MSGNGRPQTAGRAVGQGADRGAGWVTLAGDLSVFRVYDLCQLLSLARATGTLFIRTPGVRGVIVVEDGAIVNARGRPNPERLGHLLRGRGAVGERELSVALAQKTGGDRRPLGAILVADGALTPAALGVALAEQARDTLAALLILPAGRFAFTRDLLFPGERRLRAEDPQALLIDALTRLDERQAGRDMHAAGPDMHAAGPDATGPGAAGPGAAANLPA